MSAVTRAAARAPARAAAALAPNLLLGLLLSLLLGLLLAAALATPAAGHALVRSTEPGAESVVPDPPERVVLHFTEPVEAAFGAIRVYDTAGRRVDDGRAAHLPGDPRAVAVGLAGGLGDGTYTVSWRVVSADGHPIGEAFLFHVGAPGADPGSALERILEGEAGAGRVPGLVHGLARWALFAGLVVLIGAWAFQPLVAAPAGVATPQAASRRRALLRAGWWLAVAATLVTMVAQIAVAAGLPLHRAVTPGLLAELAGTRYGLVSLGRLALLALAAVLWRQGTADRVPRAGWFLALALAATPGLAGHAGALRPAAAHVLVDALHVVAAGVWVGGLAVLWGLTRDAEVGPALVTRFSRVALRAVAVLVVTGVARSWAEVGAADALFGTAYGTALLVKLGLFAPILALAAFNRSKIQPRLSAAEGGRASLGLLRRLVAAEVLLGVVVLGVTAVLVNLPPAKVDAGLAGPFVTEAPIGEGSVQIVVDPNRVGENIVHVTLLGPDSRPMEVEAVTVRFRMPEEGIGPIDGEGLRLGPGHFAVQGRQLSVPGRWELEIVAQVDRFTDLSATVTVRLRG